MDGWKPENCIHDESPLEGSLYLLQVCDENNSQRFYIFVLTVLHFINEQICGLHVKRHVKQALNITLRHFIV